MSWVSGSFWLASATTRNAYCIFRETCVKGTALSIQWRCRTTVHTVHSNHRQLAVVAFDLKDALRVKLEMAFDFAHECCIYFVQKWGVNRRADSQAGGKFTGFNQAWRSVHRRPWLRYEKQQHRAGGGSWRRMEEHADEAKMDW